MSEIEIRELGPADAPAYRALRLLGLREAPEAFGSTHEEDAAMPLEAVAERLRPTVTPSGRVTMGAFTGGRLVGIAACVQESHRKARHKAAVYGMYVLPEARGRGVGRALVERLATAARSWGDVERLTLTVVERAAAARRLYAAAGFEPFGREPDGLRQDGVHDAVIYMALALTSSRATLPPNER